MKSLIVPLLCVILVAVFWYASFTYTAATTDELSSALETVYDQVSSGSRERAAKAYGEFQLLWKKCSRVYAYYMDSTSVSEIDLSVSRCRGYIETGSVSLACGEIAAIGENLRLMRQENVFSADNIF